MLSRRRRVLGATLAAAYAVGLLVVLLSPSAEVPIGVVDRVATALHSAGLIPRAVGGAQVEFALNVLMFVPFGFAGYLLRDGWWHPWSAAACGAAISVAVETVQGLALDGRSASVTDLVANVLGAGLGGLGGSLLAQLRARAGQH